MSVAFLSSKGDLYTRPHCRYEQPPFLVTDPEETEGIVDIGKEEETMEEKVVG
jgi:hypothetical protein